MKRKTYKMVLKKKYLDEIKTNGTWTPTLNIIKLSNINGDLVTEFTVDWKFKTFFFEESNDKD